MNGRGRAGSAAATLAAVSLLGGLVPAAPPALAAGSRLTCVAGMSAGILRRIWFQSTRFKCPIAGPGSRCCCPHALTDWSRDPASEQGVQQR